ncbi:MAG: type II secretion system protein GspE [Deltaproteobacteria bacterium CG07_land_8_20_14_0_80_38_7]|nr:MAG: type II secretion system protein GspE [Deltaproteobacteria bacterium CG07_land_8_20_14_0_80_38_7]
MTGKKNEIYTLEEIGKKMVEAGLLSVDQMAVALETRKNRGGNLGRILIKRGFVTKDQISDFFIKYLEIPFISLKECQISSDVHKIVPLSLAQHYSFMPLSRSEDVLKVAMYNPLDIYSIDDIRLEIKLRIQPVLASESDVKRLLEEGYRINDRSENSIEDIQYINLGTQEVDSDSEISLAKLASGTKVIEEVNKIISNAVLNRASDIHIEPMEKSLKVRYRIDGLLEERALLSQQLHAPILTRIKIISGMDIAERRIPQDGRVRMKLGGRMVDMRISTYPTMYGEKIVIRLLTQETVLTLEDLGFSSGDKQKFENIITKPHGVFLVTGPTGSGKTTTLYAALQRINSQDKNIISIEDPIENEMTGINQAQVNIKAGLTFASALRSILRQDPDIIMVGEIRDQETADIVVRSAITGHLVFSTLHTNTAAGAITRLIDLGIERFLIASAIVGLLSQRLVRKICSHCKEEVEIAESQLILLGTKLQAPFYKGKGCKHCNMTGYSGRLGLFELISIDPEIRDLILEGASERKIIEEAKNKGTIKIRNAGINFIKEGITTIEEVLRVTEE